MSDVNARSKPPKRDYFWAWWLIGIPMPPRKTRKAIFAWFKRRQLPEAKILRHRKLRQRVNRFGVVDKAMLALSLPLLFIEAHGEFKLVARWRKLPRWAKWTIVIVVLSIIGSVF
jgi:hypothetical protein